MAYSAFFYEDMKDVLHAGRKGMKRGYHLFGDRDYDPIGEKAQGPQAPVGNRNPAQQPNNAGNPAQQPNNAGNQVQQPNNAQQNNTPGEEQNAQENQEVVSNVKAKNKKSVKKAVAIAAGVALTAAAVGAIIYGYNRGKRTNSSIPSIGNDGVERIDIDRVSLDGYSGPKLLPMTHRAEGRGEGLIKNVDPYKRSSPDDFFDRVDKKIDTKQYDDMVNRNSLSNKWAEKAHPVKNTVDRLNKIKAVQDDRKVFDKAEKAASRGGDYWETFDKARAAAEKRNEFRDNTASKVYNLGSRTAETLDRFKDRASRSTANAAHKTNDFMRTVVRGYTPNRSAAPSVDRIPIERVPIDMVDLKKERK